MVWALLWYIEKITKVGRVVQNKDMIDVMGRVINTQNVTFNHYLDAISKNLVNFAKGYFQTCRFGQRLTLLNWNASTHLNKKSDLFFDSPNQCSWSWELLWKKNVPLIALLYESLFCSLFFLSLLRCHLWTKTCLLHSHLQWSCLMLLNVPMLKVVFCWFEISLCRGEVF